MADGSGIDPRHDPIFQRGYDPSVHGGPSAVAPETTPGSRADRRRPRASIASAEPGATDGTTRDDGVVALFAPVGDTGSVNRAEPVGPPPAPTAERPPGPPPARSGPGDLVFPGTEPRAADGGSAGSGDDADASTRRVTTDPPSPVPWRNPWLLGLLIGGAVLALVGYQLFRSAVDAIYADFATSGFLYGGTINAGEDAPDPIDALVSMQVGWSLGPLLVVLGIAAILSVVVFTAVRWRPAPASERREKRTRGGS